MRIPLSEARAGDILVFKRTGPVSFILGGILKFFEREWDGFGWHTGFVVDVNNRVVTTCEAMAYGVTKRYYADWELTPDRVRVYRWFDEQPSKEKIQNFLDIHLGMPYDIAIYFWTTFAVIVRHYWNRPIWKLLDRRFSCWELTQEFTTAMGKPIISPYDVVVITDIVKALSGEL